MRRCLTVSALLSLTTLLPLTSACVVDEGMPEESADLEAFEGQAQLALMEMPAVQRITQNQVIRG